MQPNKPNQDLKDIFRRMLYNNRIQDIEEDLDKFFEDYSINISHNKVIVLDNQTGNMSGTIGPGTGDAQN